MENTAPPKVRHRKSKKTGLLHPALNSNGESNSILVPTLPSLPEVADETQKPELPSVVVLSANEQIFPGQLIPPQAAASTSSDCTGSDEDSPASKTVPISPLPSPPLPLHSAHSLAFPSASTPSPAGSVPPSPVVKTLATLAPYSELNSSGFSSFPEVPLSDFPLPLQVQNTEATQSTTELTTSTVTNQLEQQLPTPSVVASDTTPLEPQLPALPDTEPEPPEPDPLELAKRPSYTRMQSHSKHDPREGEPDPNEFRPSFLVRRTPSKFEEKDGEPIHNPRLSRKSVPHLLALENLPKEWLLDSPTREDSDETPAPETPAAQTTNAQPNTTPVIGLDIESGHNRFYSACYGVLTNPFRSVALLITGVASMYLVNLLDKSGRQFFSHFQENSYSKSDQGVTRGAGVAIALSVVALAAIIKYCCPPKVYNLIEPKNEVSR